MDEKSWLFFCNNSPKLVQRSKSPILGSYSKAKIEVPGLLLSKVQQSKSNLRPLESVSTRRLDLCKISIRSIYKDQNDKLRQSQSGSKLPDKQNISFKENHLVKRNVSPVSLVKKPFLSKRLNFLYKKIN
jgi:hypothetical protein